jgi:hypothetical protein
LIVGIAYGSIWWKLRNHRNKLRHHQQNTAKPSPRNELKPTKSPVNPQPSFGPLDQMDRKNTMKKQENNRRLKMNVLLAFIAIIFAASWLPINLFNILSDSKNTLMQATHTYYIVNAICILLGMSSAVSNPFLYGVLNENFKREYIKLLNQFTSRILVCFKTKKKEGTANGRADDTTEKKNAIVKSENQKLLKSRPIILINNESMNESV